jgi:murein L,D-transpeptidase YafK
MRFFFILLFFTYSNASGLEKNQPNNQESFFDKNPSEQRNIFINEFKNIFSKNKELQKDTNITVSKLNEIETVESLLIKALELISDGKLDEAGEVTDQLIILAPNFKLAHLIRGDILSAYAMSVENFGGSAVKINSNQVNELKKEAQRRIKGYLSSQNENKLPKFNILPGKKDKYLIYVDMDSSRLFVFENSNKKYLYLSDYYISIGKNGYGKRFEGDKKTPYGTYFLQKKIKRELIDFYGNGAYPLNYPNKFDKINKYTGSGIWVHGTPKSTYSRPPEASDGCIVLSNKDLSEIEYVLNTPGTPIILSNLSIADLSLRKNEDIKNDQKLLLSTMENWKESWMSKNYSEYIDFYTNYSLYNKTGFKRWSLAKKDVFKRSKNIKISLNNISIYEYPSEQDQLRIVLFTQNYKSNLIANVAKKKQIWKMINGYWKIIYEGNE